MVLSNRILESFCGSVSSVSLEAPWQFHVDAWPVDAVLRTVGCAAQRLRSSNERVAHQHGRSPRLHPSAGHSMYTLRPLRIRTRQKPKGFGRFLVRDLYVTP